MSISSAIGNIFRPVQPVTVVNAPPQNPQAPTAPQNPMARAPAPQGATLQVHNPGSDPALQQPPQQNSQDQPQSQTPLDDFAKLWDTDPTATPPTNPWDAPLLPGSDPTKIQAAAKNVDMLAGVPQELMTQAMSGSDPQAFMKVINAVAQNTLAMSAQLASASVEKAGSAIRERTAATLPTAIRDVQLKNMPVDNPVLSHPGAQGMLQLARQQLTMKNPGWNAAQINAAAEQYLSNFAQAVTSGANPQQGSQQEVDPRTGQPIQDWSIFE